jgi:serine/threonine protein kinase
MYSWNGELLQEIRYPGLGANILRDPAGNVKLSDFGISDKLPTFTKYEIASSVSGTMPYMAPELFDENPITTPKIDIW